MSIFMVVSKLLFFICLMAKILFAQNPDPLSYFPHHLGDYWEYQFYFPDCSSDNQTYQKVLLDSLLPDSNYLVHIGIYEPFYSNYLINSSTFEVIAPGGIASDSAIIYKLDAQLGEWWFADIDNTLKIKIIDIYTTSIFGIISTVKVFDFWGIWDTDSLWEGRDYLATDFGLIRQDVEGGCMNGNQIMYCAVINNVQYGNCILGIDDFNISNIIKGFNLYPNYPNPFNNATQIKYDLPRPVFVNLSIYNIVGEKVLTLVNEVQNSGNYVVNWEGWDSTGKIVSSGIYIYILNAGAYKKSNKMVFLK